MRVEVRLYATLRRYAPSEAKAGVFPVELPEGSSVAELLQIIEIAPADVHMLMVNGISAAPDCILSSDDRVGLFPPVGGG